MFSFIRRRSTPNPTKKTSRPHHRPRLFTLERLEDRRLLSGNAPELIDLNALRIDPQSFDDSAILVRFRDGAQAAADHSGVRLLSDSNLWRMPIPEGLTVADAIAAYQQRTDVLYVEPDYRVSIALTPDDPLFGDLWGLNNIGQTGGTLDADIDAPEAWEVTTGVSSMLVAVIDTGIDYTHPDLAANIWTNPGEIAGDGIDNDGNGFVDDVHGYDFVNNDGDPMDDHGHGTHVAGTIGALNNAVGVVGVSPNVQLMAVKFLDAAGGGFVSGAVSAIDYAVQMGAQISNNSWGGGGFNQSLFDAIERARLADHIFVAAAGNLGVNVDLSPHYPSSYDLDNIISVAATDHNDVLASFSNYGAISVDLGAPGVSILSTVPTSGVLSHSSGYRHASGTSMATPHVAGTVALLGSLHPEWSYSQVINEVLTTVDPNSSLGGKSNTGGRLNAATAVGENFAPRVVSHSPHEFTTGPVSSVQFTFSKLIESGTFTTADIVSFSGPNATDLLPAITSVSGSGNLFTVSFNGQSALGSYNMIIGPDILDTSGRPMNQDEDEVDGESPDDQYTATFQIEKQFTFSGFGGELISDAAPAILAVNVDQDITIADLDVQIDLTHSWDSQLEIYLVAPDGQTVPLALQRGSWGNNFEYTIFSDEAFLPIGAGQSPFIGRFRPEQPLSVFDGMNALGQWELQVYDRVAGDTGFLFSTSLFIIESPPITDDTTAPSVAVQSPNGGESWTVGSVHNITWSASDNVGVTAVDLHYSTDGGNTFTVIAQGEANDGSYTWTVPDATTVAAMIKVVARDAAGNQTFDLSDGAFMIVSDATPGIRVTPTSGLVTNEDGDTASFDVVLDSQPTANVTIGISSSDTTEGTVSASVLTFTPSNWNSPQTVAITGVDDMIDDGDVSYTIVTTPASSGDADYNGLNAADVAVTNTDDDEAGITVSPTSGLVTTEDGDTASFDVVLDSQPTADVTIGISSSDTSEGTVSASSLTFTPSNWSTPQTTIVTGIDDGQVDGNVAYSVVTAAASSTDANYSGLNPADVAVVNMDNDASPGSPNDIYVSDIAFDSRTRGKGGKFYDVRIIVTVRRDSDADGITESSDEAVADASVTVSLSGPLSGTYTGTTNGSGEFTTRWIRNVPDGTLTAEVTNLSHSIFTWNGDLDPTAADGDADGDGLPDEQHSVPGLAALLALVPIDGSATPTDGLWTEAEAVSATTPTDTAQVSARPTVFQNASLLNVSLGQRRPEARPFAEQNVLGQVKGKPVSAAAMPDLVSETLDNNTPSFGISSTSIESSDSLAKYLDQVDWLMASGDLLTGELLDEMALALTESR